MNLLLDTHIWIWLTLEPARLSRRVGQALDDSRNQLWLSPMSVWELLMLSGKGKVRLNADPVRWARQTIEKLGLQEAALTTEVAFETESLLLAHADPADRWLAASAKVFNLTLVTGDEKLIAAPEIKILANR
jgi:PIN domain nuclease of toxin-antitoxin system